MDYKFRLMLAPLAGGVGIAGRFVIAMCILAVVKFLNRNDKEADKGIKKLIIGRLVTVLLAVFAVALFAGLYFAGFTLPLWYFFD